MTLTLEDRKTIIDNHLKKSDRLLKSAARAVSDDPEMSVVASYQAAFHTTLALFISDGIEVQKSHKAMGSLLNEVYIRGEGSLPNDMAKTFFALSKDRNTGAYDESNIVTKENAERNLEDAKAYCSVITVLVQEKANRHSADQEIGDLEKEVKDLHLMKSNVIKIYTKPNELIEYKGEILHVNESKGYSVQKTGNSTLFVHKHENLERKPEVGEVLKIKYRGNEKGTIKSVERAPQKHQGLSR